MLHYTATGPPKRGTAPGPVVIFTFLFLNKLCPKSPCVKIFY
jgi:hypothetical protein